MECTLTPESAIMLDKLLRLPKSELLVFNAASLLVVQLLSASMTSMAQIKLEPVFFAAYSARGIRAAIPHQKFHLPGMSQLTIRMGDLTTSLEYQFPSHTYTRTVDNLEHEPTDITFVPAKSVAIDFARIGTLLKGIKEKCVTLSVGDSTQLSCKGTSIVLGAAACDGRASNFRVETELLKLLLHFADLLCGSEVVLSDDENCLNAVFRGADILASVFVAIN
ncbi:hypothetical protein PAPHI01_2400 [Pancytospora philotis]|nr:hypothetical protein PAPHI01_2400 [Pancytospora philotis]